MSRLPPWQDGSGQRIQPELFPLLPKRRIETTLSVKARPAICLKLQLLFRQQKLARLCRTIVER
jgi:hypothetical protein